MTVTFQFFCYLTFQNLDSEVQVRFAEDFSSILTEKKAVHIFPGLFSSGYVKFVLSLLRGLAKRMGAAKSRGEK